MSSFSLRIPAVALFFLLPMETLLAAPPDKAEPSVNARPEMTKSQQELVMANVALNAGHPDLACQLMKATTPADSVDPDRLYVLARCSAQMKHIDAAIGYYKRTIALLPNAARPRAELAALYLATERYAEAQPLFSEAASLMPPGKAASQMRNLAEQLASGNPATFAQQASAKPWSLELFTGITYDDNVNGGPISNIVPAIIGGTPINFELRPEAMPRSSWGAAASISGSYVMPINQRWAVLLQGALGGTHYFAESDFGNDSLSLAAAFIYRDERATASIQPNVRYSRLDGRMQDATPGIVGRYSRTLSPMWTATASAGYFRRLVHVDDNRDANGHHGSLGLIAKPTQNLQVGGEYEMRREKAELDVHSRRLRGPRVFATWRVTPTFTVVGNYSHSKIEHDERMVMFAAAREDRQKMTGLTGLWDVSRWAGRNLVVRAQYVHVANPSNIAYNDYKRNLFSLGVQTQF